jgi:hypothetical protein
LFYEFIDFGSGNRFRKTTSENQNAPLPDKLSARIRRLKPKTVSLDRKPKSVPWQKIELVTKRLWKHYSACFIDLNCFGLHGIYDTICQCKMEEIFCLRN